MLSHFARAAAGNSLEPIELIDTGTHTDALDDFSFDISGLTFANGDVAIFALSGDWGDNSGNMTISGWTRLFISGNDLPGASVFVRTMDGTETTIASISGTGLKDTCMIVAFFRNAVEPTTITSASGAFTMPDPPSVSGVVESDWVIAIGHLDDDNVTATAPTNHTLIETVNHGGASTETSSTMMSYRTGVTGTEDPGLFGGGGGDDWDANTLILENG